MTGYHRDVYERTFARLLNKALKKGKNDSERALVWLDKRYHLLFAMLMTRDRIETVDAYMDVREHLEQRLLARNTKKENLENDAAKE